MHYSKDRFDHLRFTDDFVFCSVLSVNEDLCRALAERILGRKIERIVYLNSQQSIQVTPDSKGVRFDVYFEDNHNTVYDIEMQNDNQRDLLRRSRYYQAVIDTEQTGKGQPYQEMKDSYVIFISKFDPFQCGYSLYEIRPMCGNHRNVDIDDGTHRIFLNPCGMEDEDLSGELKAFLSYLVDNVPKDEFTRNLDNQVRKTIESEDWRRQYMTLEEKIEMGRKEGVEIGRDEKQCEMIRNMINNDFPVEMIAKAAGTTEEALRAFAREHGIELE